VSEHGGTIRVKNTAEHGASFRIELPIRSYVGPRARGEEESQRPARRGRILVVEANASVLETIAGLLTGNGHMVTTSKSVEEARSLVAAGEFDLVVADWQMVYENQLVAGRQNGLDQDYGLGPRVLWTSSVSAGEKGAGRVVPPDAAILQKPFPADELYAAVESWLFRVASPILQE